MSSVRGTISVDVAFTDSTTVSGAQSLKTIVLRDATEYTTGKVAIFTGTVGTASNSSVSLAPPMLPSYRDSTGEEVNISIVSRIAFQASRECTVVNPSSPSDSLRSRGGVALTDWPGNALFFDISAVFTAGTASYTLVVYGS
jgi:hypothetical protein